MDAFYQYVANEDLRDVLKSMQTVALSSGDMAEGTDSGTIKTASAIDYAIAGVHQSQKSATDNIDPTPADGVKGVADNTSVILGVFLDISGTVKTYLGAAKSTGSGDDLALPDFDPESLCCVDAVKLVNASGGSIDVGTADITGTTGLSATFFDLYHAIPFQVIDEA